MRYLALVCVIVAAAYVPARAADENAIQTAVESFLTRLGDHKLDTLDADFAPKAIIVVSRQRDGQWTNSYQTAEE